MIALQPILAFAEQGTYNPSPDGLLSKLVKEDVQQRLAVMDAAEQLRPCCHPDTGSAASQRTKTQEQWTRLIRIGQERGENTSLGTISVAGITPETMDDLRVAPLLTTRWDQATCYKETEDINGNRYMIDSGVACYNFYTPPGEPGDPNNYSCGCTATAMAQLMRFHEWPIDGIGLREFQVGIQQGEQWPTQTLSTRGGDGQGGPYDWVHMVARPDGSDLDQCQAIGALCYDTGLSVGMTYGVEQSHSSPLDIAKALTETFQYASAISGVNAQDGVAVNIGSPLIQMIHPNLDAGQPVLLALTDSETDGGHAVVCDGYGFRNSVAYYHLNMGESKRSPQCSTVWYQLIPPDISDTCQWSQCEEGSGCLDGSIQWSYDTIITCIYNVSPDRTGEIISGRVLDNHGQPVPGIAVIAEAVDAPNDTYRAQTDANGIFAITECPSQTRYALSVDSPDANYAPMEVETGTSGKYTTEVGNVCGLELRDLSTLYVPDDYATIQQAVDVATNGPVRVGTCRHLYGGRKPGYRPGR